MRGEDATAQATNDCGVDDIADGIVSVSQEQDFTPSRVVTTLPPPTRLLPVFLGCLCSANSSACTCHTHSHSHSHNCWRGEFCLGGDSKRLAARRERTKLALAASMLEAEATHDGPSPTPNEEDGGKSTVVGVVGRGKVSPVLEESSQLKWDTTIDTNPIVWSTSKE
jgi:hypothetical protein